MKKWALLFLTLVGTLPAEIIEAKKMEEVLPHLSPGTLVVFDIDNTLMEPTQTLGSDQWFCHQITKYLHVGMSKYDALEKAIAEWHGVQNITGVKLVEEGTASFIASLQEQGYKVIGLTSRGISMATRTVEQLSRLGIDLLKSAPHKEELFFINENKDVGMHGNLYRGGILFTAGTHKGKSLEKWQNMTGFSPEKIVQVDDKKAALLEVEQVASVPYVGLRYGYLDDKVKAFNRELADVQFEKFRGLVSDSEALEILEKR